MLSEVSDQEITEPEADRSDAFLAAALRGEGTTLKRASWLAAVGESIWPVQAYVLASAIGAMVGGADTTQDLWTPALVFAALALVRTVLGATASRLAFLGAERVKSRLRQRLVERLGQWSPLDGHKPDSGEAAALFGESIEALDPYLVRYGPARLRATIEPLFVLALVLSQSWAAALILLFTGPLIPVFMALIGSRARAASEAQMVEILSINRYLADRLSGLADIKLLGAVDTAGAQFSSQAMGVKRATMAVLRVAFLSSAVLELFAAVGVALVAVYVGFSLLGMLHFGTYSAPLTFQTGLFVLMLSPEFYAPLRGFAAAYHDRASATAAAGALERAFGSDFVAIPTCPGRSAAADDAATGVQIRNLGFRHTTELPRVLDGFNIEIAPGEWVALTGPSGVGKTTLLSLIAGLGAPEEGEIAFPSPSKDRPAAARPRIAWLPQHPFFFRGTIRQNLTLGRTGITDAEIGSALELAQAARLVASLPRGLSTMLGEGGTGVSGGEAQRLAIARAALAKAGLVIADEPTAHLDPVTAEAVREGLARLAAGRTLIVATHDPVLAAAMAREVVMTATGKARP